MKLRFTKIDKGHGYDNLPPALRRATNALEQDYETNGEATHFAITSLDETAFAYPVDGHDQRLILVCPAGTNYADDGYDACPEEWLSEASDAQLEAGICTRLQLF